MENKKKNHPQFFYQHKNKINYKKRLLFLFDFREDKILFFCKYNINKVIYNEQILFDKINIICGENYLCSWISLSIGYQKYNDEIILSLYNYIQIIPYC